MREPEVGPSLRRMKPSDLGAVMEVDARSMERPWSEAIWKSELESPFGLYLILEEGDEILGQIGIRSVLDELHITTVAVHPEHRGRGHARALIQAAISAYPDAGLVHLEVRPTNGKAISLYRSLGFRQTGRRPRYYGDEDALLMTLDLPAGRP